MFILKIADAYLRGAINVFMDSDDNSIPVLVEIPSKETPYDPRKDPIMQKLNKAKYASKN